MRTVACIIPTHGRPDFLRESLHSVLSQRGVSVAEIVVVDDVGTPETAAIVNSLAQEIPDKTITYAHRADGLPGASASRNYGFAETSSDIIAFLDDDDLWTEDHLRLAVAALEEGGRPLSLSWMSVQEDDGAPRPHFSPTRGLTFKQVLSVNPGVTGSNMVMTRDAFVAAGRFDEKLPVSNDKDFFAAYLRSGQDYTVVESRTVIHRRHSSGQLTAWNDSRANGLEAYLLKYSDVVSAADRRYLQRQIHSIRSRTYRGFPRLREAVLLILRSSPSTLRERVARRLRRAAGPQAHVLRTSPGHRQ
ncbi:glycosyltransferase family 2 protein [Microbacterium radiodurans]|uniref:Glycosyltransferase family 2 protein n=1 Tax=Microbacterium radiodurans TaxID=661398 RepID=A0A5J5ISE5_9MICO|nr:glycosyltransferase family 2 protein [Microbacterium radiodurans]KAA9084156.1 glycosyltransferase family 2 protein [Microbacterium radiodurans]